MLASRPHDRTTTSLSWRRLGTLLVAASAGALLAVAPGGVAYAEPDTAAVGNEGGTPLLRDVLETTGRQYLEAETALNNSKTRQLALTIELTKLERRVADLTIEVREVATVAYRTGRLSATAALLNSSSPDAFLQRASAVDLLATRDDQTLRALNQAKAQASQAKTAIDAEVAEQAKQVAVMAKQKQDAERALALVGGKATGGYVVASSPVAKQAPRNSNGSWPSEGCSKDDPTTTGCLTGRMLHALQQAKAAGFNKYVACYRSGGPYEHPKGRACDFSVRNSGFGGAAVGAERLYGNNLTAFFVRNASRIGVLYVIWYKQIWSPAVGWRAYGGAYGDPSSNHTNHVHLSVV